MILYPAIDIYGGKCVRLERGDFKQAKVYYEKPVDAAKKWADLGASWLHVVDLDGAVAGKPVNLREIEEVMTSVNIPVEIGGGIRDEETAEIFLTLGAGRVVLGSAALEDPDLLQILCIKFEGRVALGIDAREGKVRIHGWNEVTDRDAIGLARELEPLGPAVLIFTDISRDGTLSGPNLDSIKEIARAVSIPVVASGGISSLDDLRKLKEIGIEGAILGRSLYEGKIKLEEALKEVG